MTLSEITEAEASDIFGVEDDEPCGGEHCGNDCGGTPIGETGDYDEPLDCVHCFCCACTSCEYARVA